MNKQLTTALANRHSRRVLEAFLRDNWIQVGWMGRHKLNLYKTAMRWVQLEQEESGTFECFYPRISNDLWVVTGRKFGSERKFEKNMEQEVQHYLYLD